MRIETPAILPVAVIGAGPVGLAAAAHLIERNLSFIVFEAGDAVGNNLAINRHVRLFSPWKFNLDPAAIRLLADDWKRPNDEDLPTAGDVVDEYLIPLARSPSLAPRLRVGARVIAISKFGIDKVKTAGRDAAPFVLHVQEDGHVVEYVARAVIDATGTWNQPNPLGAHGLPAMGERENAERIVYGMPDVLGDHRVRYAGKKLLVVGAGHSAAGNLLALAALAADVPSTKIVWAIRGGDLRKLVGGGNNDRLRARGALGTAVRRLVEAGSLEVHYGFQIQAIERRGGTLTVIPADPLEPAVTDVDEVIASTGARPDLSLTRELRMRYDEWLESTEALAPLIDPNVHSCGTVRPHGHRELQHPERGYYALGAKSYGRAPNFLMRTGYEQARSVVAALVGDLASADRVELELPETGVCSTDLLSGADTPAAANGCCGGPPKDTAAACCALDEEKKAEGKRGCGSSSSVQVQEGRRTTSCCS